MRKVLTRGRFSLRAGQKPLKREAGKEKKSRETRNFAQLRNPRVPQLIARTRASAQLRRPAGTLNPRVSIKTVPEKARPPQLRAAGAKV